MSAAQRHPGRRASYKAARHWMWHRGLRRCTYCDIEMTMVLGDWDTLTVDHDVPLVRGGSDGWENLVPCCNSCNQAKDTMTGAEYLDLIPNPYWEAKRLEVELA